MPLYIGPDSAAYDRYATLTRSLQPKIIEYGLATAAEIDIDTLEQRLREEAMATRTTNPAVLGRARWTMGSEAIARVETRRRRAAQLGDEPDRLELRCSLRDILGRRVIAKPLVREGVCGMNEALVGTILFLLLAAIDGWNGVRLALRARQTLRAAGLSCDGGPGLLVQEFGVYSIGIAAAYLVAASDPTRFWGVAIAGIAINLSAGAMHLLRSVGIYLGDAEPLMSAATERKAGFVHAAGLFALVIIVVLLPGVPAGAGLLT